MNFQPVEDCFGVPFDRIADLQGAIEHICKSTEVFENCNSYKIFSTTLQLSMHRKIRLTASYGDRGHGVLAEYKTGEYPELLLETWNDRLVAFSNGMWVDDLLKIASEIPCPSPQ